MHTHQLWLTGLSDFQPGVKCKVSIDAADETSVLCMLAVIFRPHLTVSELGDVWFTPPLFSGCLPGIERARLIDDGEVVEATLRPEDLRLADEAAVINSLGGWQQAALLDGFTQPDTFPTERILSKRG
jgi:hypothetical protein